jgi:hypothetical protein
MRIIGIIIIFFSLIVAATSGCLSTDNKSPADLLEPRDNSEAGIKITLTYLPDIADAKAFELKVTAHQNYNDDFLNNSYLRDPGGNTYQPVSYEGSIGHHAVGTLKFPSIESKRFEVVIRDVAGVKDRIFKW